MTDRPLNREALIAALDWSLAAGVDLAVGEEPIDRFALSRARPAATPAPPPTTTQPSPPLPSPALNGAGLDADPAEARSVAAQAQTLDALREALANFEGCG